MVEQRTENPRVGGSSPPPGICTLMYIKELFVRFKQLVSQNHLTLTNLRPFSDFILLFC